MSAEMLRIFYHYNHYVVKINTEGLTHEDSLFRPTPSGNCVNWVLGHILANRSPVLRTLGEEPVWTKATAKPYERGSDPLTDESHAVRLEKILEDLSASQERIMRALKEIPPDQLSGPPPTGVAKDDDDTVASLLAALAFHEAYHAGQTGLIRRLLGKEGAIR
jgi:uncharacterized damage-inducible protein DinB